jgi:SAM-dependent methyltransferase
MEVRGRTLLRGTFDAVADEYDRVRPRYPEAVFDDLVDMAGLRRGARVIEIGPGTGQATVALARRGLAVVAVEMGAELAAVTRRHAAAFSGVEVVNARFEDWEPEVGGFDAVTSFAALHWIDPAVRYAKSARLLRPGGAIAVFDWQDTLSDDGDDFFHAVLDDYETVVPEWERTPPVPPALVLDRVSAELAASGVFAPAASRRYHWSVTYGADGYVAFMNTRSSHRLLPEDRREALFARIRARIGARDPARVRQELLGTLAVARL